MNDSLSKSEVPKETAIAITIITAMFKMFMMYLLFSDLIIVESLSKVKLYILAHTNLFALQYAITNLNLSNYLSIVSD